MKKKAQELLLQQVTNLEIGLSEAVGAGAFKNLRFCSDLQNSINVLRAYFESAPIEADEAAPIPQTNGKAKA